MKNYLKLLLLAGFYFLVSCSTGPSVHKDVVRDNAFVYGRIKIYQVYDERKIREISANCYLPNNVGIERGARSNEPGLMNKNRFDYIFKHGLLAFKSKLGSKFDVDQIYCNPDDSMTTISVKNFHLTANFNNDGKIIYFGDVDIFIAKVPDDKYVHISRCVGKGCGGDVVTTTLYHYPKKILISNNQKETYEYLNSKIKKINKNNLDISYQPIKMKEKNETTNIPESKKKMPF